MIQNPETYSEKGSMYVVPILFYIYLQHYTVRNGSKGERTESRGTAYVENLVN